MKIPENLKIDIQCFSYFLFKGTYSSELIHLKEDYVSYLLNNDDLLYNCFKIFANQKNRNHTINPEKEISNYIIVSIKNKNFEKVELNKLNNFWLNFLKLSQNFCFNEFPQKVPNFNLKDFNGVGSDVIPYFAVWTNVVEIDEDFNVINKEFALKRANERLLILDNSLKLIIPKFERWEIEQELY